ARLRPDTSLRSLFPPNVPAATALDRVLNDFPTAEELLVLATTPGDEPRPAQLLAFADRLHKQVAADAEASALVAAVKYRVDERTREFFTKVVVPNGLFYLSDAEFAAARQRLTRAEMDEQLRR